MARRIGKIVLETGSLLRESYTLNTLKTLPEDGLDVFFGLMFGKLKSGSLDFTPRPIFRPTGLTGDDAVICHLVWTDETVTSALAATRRHFDVHVDNLSTSVA